MLDAQVLNNMTKAFDAWEKAELDASEARMAMIDAIEVVLQGLAALREGGK